MAILVVCAQDRPVTDSPGRWYRGMPVAAFHDDHEFGAKEGPPWNLLFHFPNVSREELTETFCREDREDEANPIGPGRLISVYARRKMVFKESKLAAAELRPGGKFSDQVRNTLAIQQKMMATFPRDPVKRPPVTSIDRDLP